MVSAKKSFYEIAADFDDASDQDVEKLKCHVIQQIGDEYGWESSHDIKLNCVKEWTLGTFIDIYVASDSNYDEYNVTHLCIDRDDFVQLVLLAT